MVPVDRFLEGLFLPHGGLVLSPPRASSFTRFSEWLRAAVRRVLATLSRPFRREDYALCI